MLEAAKELLQEHASSKLTTVEVGVPCESFITAELIKRCKIHLPHLNLVVTEDMVNGLVKSVEDEFVDLACVYRRPNSKTIAYEPLTRERLWLVGRREDVVSADGPVRFAEAAQRPLILPKTDTGLYGYLEEAAYSQDLALNLKLQIQAPSLVRKLLREGFGETICPSARALHYIEEDGLGVRSIVEPRLAVKLGLITKETRRVSRHARQVGELIRTIADDEADLIKRIETLPS